MNQPTLQRVPLAAIQVAPENARRGAKDLGDLAALTASIEAVGDLIDPLHVYPEGEAFLAWDGGRRLAALQLLAKGKKPKLPGALAEGVPCLVSASKEDAALLSAATFTREAMHPADEFLHYQRLFDAGMEDHGRIAAACGVPTPRVRQILRLSAVAPAILDALRAGEIALDVAEAFTLSSDHAKQLGVLEAVKGGGQVSAWRVKQAFKSEAIDPDSRWAIFVGREAYEAAGGAFLSDLFSQSPDDELWADKALALSLAQQQVNALVAAHEANGWASVTFLAYEQRDYNDSWKKGLREVAAKVAQGLDAEARAALSVFILQGYRGEIELTYWERIGKVEAAAASGKEPVDQDLHGFGHSGHHVLTSVATEATRVAIMEDPEAAYDGLLTHLAWVALRTNSTYDQERSSASALRWNREPRRMDVVGSTDFTVAVDTWRERLGGNRVGFCDQVASLAPEEKAQLLAVCFAATLQADEGRFDYLHAPQRWGHLGWLARRAKADFRAAWTPRTEFLKKGTKGALIKALEWAGMGASLFDGKKKQDLVTYVLDECVTPHQWLPKLLRDLVDPPEAEKPAKAPRKAKGKAKAPAEGPAAPEAEDEPSAALKALAGAGKPRPIKGADADAEA